MFRLDITFEKRPDMIATKMVLSFDQSNIKFRTQFVQCQCDQPTSQPATCYRQIILVSLGHTKAGSEASGQGKAGFA